jgi:hypothetical protein
MDAWAAIDPSTLRGDDLVAWLRAEPEPMPVPFKQFPLCTNEGRLAFLDEYIFWGEERMFEAVSHLWDSLCEPKDVRCIGIGLAAGTGGIGKVALAKFLTGALRAALDYEVPQPDWEDGQTIDEFHHATTAFFADSQHHFETQVQLYADLLVAIPGQQQYEPLPPRFKLLQGPWPPARVVDGVVINELR